MTKWEIDTPLRREGGYEDDEKADHFDAPDWVVWLKRPPEVDWKGRTRHMQIRFARDGVDRAEAEQIVARILAGLAALSKEQTDAKE